MTEVESTSAGADRGDFGVGETGPITLSRMGSFFFGGKVVTNELGDTYHGDHGYTQYFIPQESRNLPLIMWHGLGQSGKTWESTPDGREGFWQIYTRRGWPVYIVDQPRRGRAGRGVFDEDETPADHIPSIETESSAWNTFRVGEWFPPQARTFFPGVAFAKDADGIEQLMRQQTPNTGLEPFPNADHRAFLGTTIAQLIRKVGPSILFTHSHSGQYGWAAAMRAPNEVKAIVALEPGTFAFPDDDLPADVPTESDLLRSFMAPQPVPADEFLKLAKIPILIMMGDNIASKPNEDFGIELWRIVRERAQQFVAALVKRGGDATFLELPVIGIRGNTHFPMSDTNNLEVAAQIDKFFASRGLDGADHPYSGPRGG